MRFPSRRHALLYLCVLAVLVVSIVWGLVTEPAWEASCPETASAADCSADLALTLPILGALACGALLRWLARRTARSLLAGLFIPVAIRQLREPQGTLAASGVPIKRPKGMSAWMTVELLSFGSSASARKVTPSEYRDDSHEWQY